MKFFSFEILWTSLFVITKETEFIKHIDINFKHEILFHIIGKNFMFKNYKTVYNSIVFMHIFWIQNNIICRPKNFMSNNSK